MTIRNDLAGLEARLALLPQERMAASVRAMNRAMVSARAQAAREMQKEYPGLKISSLRARMKLVRATRTKPTAAVVFSGRRISLFGNFGMRRRGQFGVRFSKLPWRAETVDGDPVTQQMLDRAFVQRGKRSGRAGVFARHTKARDSFEAIMAPGLARAFKERGIDTKLRAYARARYAVIYKQELKFRLLKAAR